MSRRHAATALAAVAAATLLGPFAGRAAADEPPVVTVTTSVDGGRATVSGHAEMNGLLGQITGVHVKVFRGSTQVASCDDGGCGATLGQGSTSFSLQTPSLAYNGPYRATAAVSGHALVNGVLGSDTTGQKDTGFQIEVKPAPPANVKAVVNPDRSVTVSWTRNGEPDLVGYQVRRRAVGSSAFSTVSPAIPQPSSGSTVQFTDTSTEAAGGNFQYVVLAVRPDGDGTVGGRATTQSAITSAVAVPAPDGGAPPIVAPGSTPAAKPGASGAPVGFDVSGFVSAGSRSAPPKIAVPGAPVLPDGTFVSTLPFSVPSGDAASAPTGGSDRVDIREAGSTSDRRGLLLPVAAGLVLCVVAFHVRLLNRKVGAPRGPRQLAVVPVPADDLGDDSAVGLVDDPETGTAEVGDAEVADLEVGDTPIGAPDEVWAPDREPVSPVDEAPIDSSGDAVVLVGGPSRR